MIRVFAILLLLSVTGVAQFLTPGFGNTATRGILYIHIDDAIRIYINGVEVYRHDSFGKVKSDEVGLKPGDRIVVQLRNFEGDKCFMMVFLSLDRTQVVSFPRQAYKLLADAEATDFNENQFSILPKYPKPDNRKFPVIYPFKHSSSYVWGDSDECALACVVKPQMFTQIATPATTLAPASRPNTSLPTTSQPFTGPTPPLTSKPSAITNAPLTILSATYGAVLDPGVADVTDRIRNVLASGKPSLTLDNGLVGFDPAGGKWKITTISYQTNGVQMRKVFMEGHKLSFKEDLAEALGGDAKADFINSIMRSTWSWVHMPPAIPNPDVIMFDRGGGFHGFKKNGGGSWDETTWAVTGARSVTLYRDGKTSVLRFDEAVTKYETIDFDGSPKIEGRPLTP